MLRLARMEEINDNPHTPVRMRGTSQGAWRIKGTPLFVYASYSGTSWMIGSDPQGSAEERLAVYRWIGEAQLEPEYSTRARLLDDIEMALAKIPPPWEAA